MTSARDGSDVESRRAGPAVKACPQCQRICPAEESRCRRCLTDLRTTPTLDPASAAARIAAADGVERGAARVAAQRRRRLIALAIPIAILVVALLVVRVFRDNTPAPLIATTNLGEPATAGAVWSRAHGGTGATRVTSAPAPASAEIRWRLEAGAAVVGISADASRVYVVLADARLIALDAESGEERWQLAVPGQLDEAPAIAGDRLYVGQRDGSVVAIEAASGRVLWSSAPAEPFFIRAAPLIADGLVWAVTERSLVVFDAEDGAIRAERPFGRGANAIGAVAVGAHVVFSTGREQRTLTRAHADQTFNYPLAEIEFIAAAAPLAVALGGSRLLAVPEDARPHWWERLRRQWSIVSFVGIGPAVPPPPRAWLVAAPADAFAPAVSDGLAFVAAGDGSMRAYELGDGSARWERRDLQARAAPVLTPDGVLVPVASALVLLDPTTGSERARLPLTEQPHAVIVTTGGSFLTVGVGRSATAVIALTR